MTVFFYPRRTFPIEYLHDPQNALCKRIVKRSLVLELPWPSGSHQIISGLS